MADEKKKKSVREQMMEFFLNKPLPGSISTHANVKAMEGMQEALTTIEKRKKKDKGK